MIPNYFRCCDPSQRCPFSVTKELLKEDSKWECPCKHQNCVDFREPVSLISVHKRWFVCGSVLAVLFLLLALLTGKDPCVPKLNEFQERFAKLEQDLTSLAGKPKSNNDFSSKLRREIAVLDSDTKNSCSMRIKQ